MKRVLELIIAFSLIAFLAISCESITNSEMSENGVETLALDLDANKKAGPNAVFALDFSDPSHIASNTPTDAGWMPDRTAPEAFEINSDGHLRINIDENGPTGWAGYQGMKYKDANNTGWGAEANARFSYKFYIDPEWETDGVKQQTGVWPTLSTADGEINAYPILSYHDSDTNPNGGAGFRAYVYTTDENGELTGAEWVMIGIPKKLKIDPAVGGWVSVEAQLHKTGDGTALKWRINNNLVLDERDYNFFWGGDLYSSMEFHEFIVNSVNYEVDQDYLYDDIVLTNPGQ